MAVDFGSQTAAPFARDILEKTLNYLGVAPQLDEESLREVQVPSVDGFSPDEAERAMEEAGLGCVFDGAGGTVIGQLPAAGASIAEGSLVMLYVDQRSEIEENDLVSVPDVTGMSVIEANKRLRSYGLSMEIEGGGIAVSQTPSAGEETYPTATVRVTFESP